MVLLGGGGFAIFAIGERRQHPIGLRNVNCHASSEYPATVAVDGFAKDNVQIQLGKRLGTPYWAYYEGSRSAGRGTARREVTHDDAGSGCVFFHRRRSAAVSR
ncbi:hypothetical protein G3I59_14790 [Amycolatopsis rubida]|uniref:Uncharacterized protein n=1 Tax=Amycolatopsis rubida TaxID=112413 RepID=A0ABX0BP95_9PSEU|nr:MULTISPECIES: hypothetical protein [Amycolatopsis]MYW91829.1 hypothetical protein [Amycolatopsis rubida]NEC56814.1 hypothetical protein [Amycolatopsis rubida]OAP28019.1 hypothetical protein A4R44_01629 [Amycolatopsis sp. M39]